MFVRQDDFKILQARVTYLEKRITGKLDIGVETSKRDWMGYPIWNSVSMKKVVEQILKHFGLTLKFTPAKEEKLVLKKIKDGKKKQDKTETKEK